VLYTNICVYVLFKGKHTLKLKCQCKYRNYVDSVIWAVFMGITSLSNACISSLQYQVLIST